MTQSLKFSLAANYDPELVPKLAADPVAIARRRLARARDPAVELLQENVYRHEPVEPYHCAVASMCFHHFSDSQILALIQQLRGFVLDSVMINDLRRSPIASIAASLLLAGTRAPAGVRHDAMLSIRRGFRVNELSSLLEQLENLTVSVTSAPWFRIAAIVRFTTGEHS